MEEDIENIREKKKKEMQEQAENQEEQIENQRKQIKQQASKYLTKEARSRMGNIRTAKPELASQIEAQIVRLGRTGNINKIDDDELKRILRKTRKQGKDTDIKFRR